MNPNIDFLGICQLLKALRTVVSQWLRGEMTAVEAQRRLELSPSTFYRKVRDYKKTENRKEG